MFFCTRKYSSHFRSEVWARGYHLTCAQSSSHFSGLETPSTGRTSGSTHTGVLGAKP
jgi:hypothetical protein